MSGKKGCCGFFDKPSYLMGAIGTIVTTASAAGFWVASASDWPWALTIFSVLLAGAGLSADTIAICYTCQSDPSGEKASLVLHSSVNGMDKV